MILTRGKPGWKDQEARGRSKTFRIDTNVNIGGENGRLATAKRMPIVRMVVMVVSLCVGSMMAAGDERGRFYFTEALLISAGDD